MEKDTRTIVAPVEFRLTVVVSMPSGTN